VFYHNESKTTIGEEASFDKNEMISDVSMKNERSAKVLH